MPALELAPEDHTRIIVVLDSRARFAGSFDERILSCLWVYVTILGASTNENWVIKFQCRVHHVRKNCSTQGSDILLERLSRSKLSRLREH
jgi:hypothetical protein